MNVFFRGSLAKCHNKFVQCEFLKFVLSKTGPTNMVCIYAMILEVFYLVIFYILLNLNITCEQHFACIYLGVLSILLC